MQELIPTALFSQPPGGYTENDGVMINLTGLQLLSSQSLCAATISQSFLTTTFQPVASTDDAAHFHNVFGVRAAARLDELSAIRGVRSPLRLVSRTEGRLCGLFIQDGHVKSRTHLLDHFPFEFQEEQFELLVPARESWEDYYYRPIFYASCEKLTEDILYVGLAAAHPEIQGRGVGTWFYSILAEAALISGYRFIGGNQRFNILPFYLKQGRYVLRELQDDKQIQFQELRAKEEGAEIFHTIKFLRSDDVLNYVRKDSLKTGVNERIKKFTRHERMAALFRDISGVLFRLAAKEDILGAEATVLEILEEFNGLLPPEQQYARTEIANLMASDIISIDGLREMMQHIQQHQRFIAELEGAEALLTENLDIIAELD